MQFAPQIFQVMGMGVRSSLLSSMITNAVNMVATFVAIYVVDRYGPTPTNAMHAVCQSWDNSTENLQASLHCP